MLSFEKSIKNLVLAALILIPFVLQGQQFFFRSYLVNNETPQLVVRDICQDEQGYLWFATTGGATKFDGHKTINFSTEDGIGNNLLYDIIEDKKNNIWMATDGGLTYFNRDTFINFTRKEGLNNEHVRAIVKSHNNTFWIATKEGVAYFHPYPSPADMTFHFITQQEGLPHNKTNSLYVDQSQNIWVATQKGVARIKYHRESNKLTVKEVAPGQLGRLSVNAFEEDEQGRLWMGTTTGVRIMGEGKILKVTDEQGLVHPLVNTLFKDNSGNMWVGTQGGISKLTLSDKQVSSQNWSPGKIRNYTERNGLCENDVLSIAQDNEGNLWFGTWGGGVCRFRGTAFVTYTQKQAHLCDNFVMEVYKDQNDRMWVGTYRGGVSRHNNLGCFSNDHKSICFTEQEGLNDNLVWAINGDNKGNIWIGTDRGINKYTGERMVNFNNRINFRGPVRSIKKDDKGNLWFGTAAGLLKYDGAHFKKFDEKDGLTSDNIYPLLIDKQSNIWIGTYGGGVFKFDKHKFKHFTREEGLAHNAVFSLEEDKHGNIWIGTLGGVTRYTPNPGQHHKRAITIDKEKGLASNAVYLLQFDQHGHLWIGTDKGLNKLKVPDPDSLAAPLDLEHYSKEDGFVGIECNNDATIRDENGHLWFGTIDGLIRFDHEAYKKNTTPSRVIIERVTLNTSDTSLPSQAKLDYDQDYLTFQYTGFCYTNPHRLRFTYKLKGFQPSWTSLTRERTVNFSNLPPGEYTFMVKARNNEGIWSEPATYHFQIEKPFWATAWFKGGVAGFTLCLVAGIYYFSILNIKRRNKLLRRMDQLKLKALRAQMNPHFIFNAMNTIQHYINNNDKQQANRYLSTFSDLMRINLEQSKSDKVSLSELIKALQLYIDLEQSRLNNQFTYHIEVDETIDADFTYLPPLLLQPYVENAISHGLKNLVNDPEFDRNGQLIIKFSLEEGYIICTIQDNGVGRQRAEKWRAQSSYWHKPQGMKMTKERVETLAQLKEQELTVDIMDLQDKQGKPQGTRVKIYIPESLTWET